MRLPNEQELRALRHALRQISIRSDGHTHEPNTAACEGWLRDFLDTVDACQEWTVDPDGDACAACPGEHPNEDGDPVCVAMEQKGLDMFGRSGKGLAVYHVPMDGQRAPDWCPLRDGVSLLVRRA